MPIMPSLLLRTGFLEALSAACTQLAAVLQQQHLPDAQLLELRGCGGSLLHTWRVLLLSRPNFDSSDWVLSSTPLAATAAPVASLACEMMLRFDSAAASGGRAGKDAETRAATRAGNTLVTDIASAYHQLEDGPVTGAGRSADTQAADVMRSDAVFKLALLLLACDVRQRRKEQRGRSAVQAVARDAGVARLAVPDYHTGAAAACSGVE
jgi:hypothetical protein